MCEFEHRVIICSRPDAYLMTDDKRTPVKVKGSVQSGKRDVNVSCSRAHSDVSERTSS